MKPQVLGLLLGVAVLAVAGPAAGQRTRDITPTPAAPAAPAAPANLYRQSWALVVGIDTFSNTRISRLNYAANDARAVAAALVSLGFPERNITVLLNERATRREIERVLGSTIRRAAKPEDRLFVFFATHGVTTVLPHGGEEGYLLPYDADPEDLSVTALSMQHLKQIGQRIPAKHMLVAVDACYGGYSLVRAQAPPVVDQRYLDLVSRSRVMQVLTAGRRDQPVIEDAGHGVFTRKLLDGLGGHADVDGDGLITLGELASWMHPRVAQASEFKQDIQWGTLDGEGQFVFVRAGSQPPSTSGGQLPSTTPTPAPAPGPAPIIISSVPVGSLTFSSRLPGVEVWLGELRIGETQAAPLRVENIAVGTYRVRAIKGQKTWEREVQVAANQRVNVVIDIEGLRDTPTPIKGEDAAEMVVIPAGEFWMGSDEGEEKNRPRRRVHLDAYYLDRYEVTNAQFKAFLEAQGYSRQELWSPEGQPWRVKTIGTKSGVTQPRYWTEPKWNDPRQPVVGVSWYEADAYCRFVGRRLPTEAEWEKAARGPEGQRYPWGQGWELGRANTDETRNGRTVAVGSYPTGVSPYGVHDMTGNVAEWVADRYRRDYYRVAPDRNPPGPAGGDDRVVRGGSYDNKGKDASPVVRRDESADERSEKIGFRCAKDGR